MDWSKQNFNSNQRVPMLKDKVELLELPDGEDFKQIRMIGPSKRIGYHMLPVFKQDGTPVMNKFKQQVRIPKVCLAFDSKTGDLPEDNEKKCPYCCMDPDPLKIEVHTNVIDRELQSDFNAKKQKKNRSKKESKKVEFFDGSEYYVAEGKASKKKTPCRYWRITSSVGSKISDYTSLNKKKTKDGKVKIYNPNHPKFGFDLNIKFDNSKKNPSEKYSCVKDERTELTDEELEYLLWNIDIEAPEDFKTAKKEAESFKKRMDAAEGSSKKRSKDDDDDEEFGDDEDLEGDDDDDEDYRRSKKSKKSSKKSKKDDDWDDDEDDEDSDDEDDDDEDEEDDEDDEQSSKKSKKAKGKSLKRKSRDDDDDDDEDDFDSDEDDEEDEDERSSKKSKQSKKSKNKSKKNKKSSKKRKDDDEDEDDSDDDDDWDDDDDD